MSSNNKLKILALDLETAPHTAYVWGLRKEYISTEHLINTGRVMCFSWKWLNVPGSVKFMSEHEHNREELLEQIWYLLDEADIIVTYNGMRFDIPTLNKELLQHGWPVPSPYKQVDLYRTVRSQFRFASNKLDHVAKELGIARKIKHNGFELWIRCMNGDDRAWKKMERYNKRDVLILDKLYKHLLPWIKGHPNVGTYGSEEAGKESCPSCGSTKVASRGLYRSKTSTYRRYCCSSCGSWSKTRLAIPGQRVSLTGIPT